MVVKILNSSSSFNAVNYNSNKINKGVGEVMDIKNMGRYTMSDLPNQEVIKDYFKSFSKSNSRIKNPQFHATISAKEREYNKYQLTEIATAYLDKMGYTNQPYIIISHNDTNNNHVHIVSTRVDINGNKIDHNFEHLRSQKAIQEVMNEKYNISEKYNLEKLLKYKYSSESTLETLLQRNGFKHVKKDDGYHFYKGGILISKVDNINVQSLEFKDKSVLKQKLLSYSKTYDTTLVYKEGGRHTGKEGKVNGTWSSEATDKLKSSLGIDIIFHHSEDKKPFGYTIIDNNNMIISKGGEILKLKEFLEPTLSSEYESIKEVQEDISIKNDSFDGGEGIEGEGEGLSHGGKGSVLSTVSSALGSLQGGSGASGDDSDKKEEDNKRRRGRRR